MCSCWRVRSPTVTTDSGSAASARPSAVAMCVAMTARSARRARSVADERLAAASAANHWSTSVWSSTGGRRAVGGGPPSAARGSWRCWAEIDPPAGRRALGTVRSVQRRARDPWARWARLDSAPWCPAGSDAGPASTAGRRPQVRPSPRSLHVGRTATQGCNPSPMTQLERRTAPRTRAAATTWVTVTPDLVQVGPGPGVCDRSKCRRSVAVDGAQPGPGEIGETAGQSPRH